MDDARSRTKSTIPILFILLLGFKVGGSSHINLLLRPSPLVYSSFYSFIVSDNPLFLLRPLFVLLLILIPVTPSPIVHPTLSPPVLSGETLPPTNPSHNWFYARHSYRPSPIEPVLFVVHASGPPPWDGPPDLLVVSPVPPTSSLSPPSTLPPSVLPGYPVRSWSRKSDLLNPQWRPKTWVLSSYLTVPFRLSSFGHSFTEVIRVPPSHLRIWSYNVPYSPSPQDLQYPT